MGTEEQLEKKENKEQKNKGHKLGTAEQLKKRKIKNIVKRIIFGVFSLNENKARQLFSYFVDLFHFRFHIQWIIQEEGRETNTNK